MAIVRGSGKVKVSAARPSEQDRFDRPFDAQVKAGKMGRSAEEGNTLKPCCDSHPALDVGGGAVIYGGSCIEPIITDADVYVRFDMGWSGIWGKRPSKGYPWEEGWEVEFPISHGESPWVVDFPIADECAPRNVDRFRKLVEWVSTQLDLGLKVHCGCIGGHGRTGTFLAALVAHRVKQIGAVAVGCDVGMKNPIKYVRAHYCQKAVESKKQVDFLVEEWGCVRKNGSKRGRRPKTANHR
jgi:hypothetical protein